MLSPSNWVMSYDLNSFMSQALPLISSNRFMNFRFINMKFTKYYNHHPVEGRL